MRRFLTIFSLYAQHALEYKARSFVWFFVILIDVSVYMLYWRGVLSSGSNSGIWTLSQAISYYLLLLVAGTLLQVHIEEEVAFEDIQYGRLSQYLLRPFSYFKFKFFQELPWRLIQVGFWLVTLIGVSVFVRKVEIIADPQAIPLVAAIVVSAFILCFIYKMTVGLIAFWTIDFWGLENINAIIFILLSGILVPLHLLPDAIRGLALFQPLGYILYYPVVAAQGGFSVSELWRVLGMQWIWVTLFYIAYRKLWFRGLRQFTAVGQ